MNPDILIWLVVGFASGAITTTALKRLLSRRGKHPMAYEFPVPPVPKPTPRVTIMAAAPEALNLQVCKYCGKGYKRVSQHIRLSHKDQVA